jgi:replicative DNA helicase
MSRYKEQEERIKQIEVRNDHLEDQARQQEPRLVKLLMKDKGLMQDCLSRGITKDCFRDETAKYIYAKAAEYYDQYKALMGRDSFSDMVSRELDSPEQQAFWRSKFDDATSVMVDVEDFTQLIDDLESRFVQTQTNSILQHYFEPILNSTSGQKDIVERFQRSVASIRKPDQFAMVKSSNISEMIKEQVWDEIKDRRDNPDDYVGLLTGFNCMDEKYNGFQKGKYIVVMAMENGGKTTFMANIALNMVMNQGLNVVYVTIESDMATFTKRMMSCYAQVNYNRILMGGKDTHSGLCDEIMNQLSTAKDHFVSGPGQNFHMVEALQGTPVSSILKQIDQKRAFCTIDAIFIDYLDVVGAEVNRGDRYDLELADVSAAFQNYGHKHDIMVMTAQQIKTDKVRELTKGGKKADPENFTIGVGDVSGSKKIAGAADMMFGLLMDQQTGNRLYVFNAKARNNAAKDRFILQFDKDSGRLSDLPSDPTGFEEIADKVIKNEEFKQAVFHEQAASPPSGLQTSMQFITSGGTGPTLPKGYGEWQAPPEGESFWSS